MINKAGGIAGRPVEYVVEDTATNVQTGIRKIRKLIMQDNCDFILGPVNSGVSIACTPITKELKTIFFAYGTALSITAEKGNRYVFRINNALHDSLRQGGPGEVGKNYYCLGVDFEWGRSVVEEAKRVFGPRGGVLVGEEYSPMGTVDFLPYLNKIDPKRVNVLIAGYFTDDVLKLAKQAHGKGPSQEHVAHDRNDDGPVTRGFRTGGGKDLVQQLRHRPHSRFPDELEAL